MEKLRQDLKFAVRGIIHRPAFNVVVILTLALGIGASAATFTIVDAVVVQPLAYDDSEQLVTVWQTFPAWREQEILREVWRRIPFSFPEYQNWRKEQTSFEDIGILSGFQGTMLGTDEPVRINVGQASASFFSVLRVRSALGRLFSAEDEAPGAERVAIINHTLWRNRFAADPDILGKPITLDASSTAIIYKVIGVLPQDFPFVRQFGIGVASQPAEMWTTLPSRVLQQELNNHEWEAIARLKPGVSIERAAEECEWIFQRSAHKPEHGGYVLTRHEWETANTARPLFILLAASGLVLLIACGNVGNLMLSEAVGRQQEIALRTALGAGKSRIVRQLLTESLLLSLSAAALGLLVAHGATRALVLLAPAGIPRLDEISVDVRAVLFVLTAAIGAAVLFGLTPALTLARMNLNDTLKESSRMRGTVRSRLQGLIVIGEISLSFALLVAAALLGESLMRLSSVNPGLRPESVLTVQIALPASRYPDEPRFAAFYNRALASLESLPGVQSVSGISLLPFGGGASSNSIEIEGRLVQQGQQRPEAQRRFVFPKYFETVGTPLLSGRTFTTADTSASDVMIVNETMSKRFWPNDGALGKRVKFNGRWHSIVGVVSDVKDRGLAFDTQTTFYIPMAGSRSSTTLVVRTANDPLQTAAAVRTAIRTIDKDLALGRMATMETLISESVSQERYRTLLIAIFAGTAGLLSAIGLYGVMSRAVARRTYEMGIRMALGAKPRDVMRIVFRRSLILTSAGIVAGCVVAVAASRVLSTFLFGIPPIHVPVYGVIVVLQFAVALFATYVPARRASRVDPAIALRSE